MRRSWSRASGDVAVTHRTPGSGRRLGFHGRRHTRPAHRRTGQAARQPVPAQFGSDRRVTAVLAGVGVARTWSDMGVSRRRLLAPGERLTLVARGGTATKPTSHAGQILSLFKSP